MTKQIDDNDDNAGNDSSRSARVETFLQQFSSTAKQTFEANRTLLSFDEYLIDVAAHPKRHLRSAAQYLMDAVRHFGHEQVHMPTGDVTRYKLFDAELDDGRGRVQGQERVQSQVIRALENFVRQGRIDRLILLHGPNGSAKTSLIQALTRAMEHFSKAEDGPLYRINWIFPVGQVQRGKLGFGGEHSKLIGSYAHLDPSQVEARLSDELRDHPLLLLDAKKRAELFATLVTERCIEADYPLADVLKVGELNLKNKRVFDALLTHYRGDVREVLRHVQVERFYLSRRYRTGVISVEPQMSVDGYSRQITADRSLGSLPTALQHLALFETAGPIVDANRGALEFNDLLKRPLDAWKYLLVATEQATASLEQVTVALDTVMLASSNELHLDAFKQHPDWPSFKGRFELITAPYLLRVSDELKIYEDQIPRALHGVHVAPHALRVAARFAVLSRLEPPDPAQYHDDQRKLIEALTPADKMALYDDGTAPERLSQKERKELRATTDALYDEYMSRDEYEGRFGASAREIRAVLLNAAQDRRFDHLSPIAVLAELRELLRARSSFEWLRREPVRGYRDADAFVELVERMYVTDLDREMRQAMGLIKAGSHAEQFERYVRHVSAWTKREKVLDQATGRQVDPDVDLMKRIEDVLLPRGELADDFRRGLIAQIGAFRLEQPDAQLRYDSLFAAHIKRLDEDYYQQRIKVVERMEQALLKLLNNEARDLDPREREQAETFRNGMLEMGYTESSARAAIAFLVQHRRAS